MIIELVDVEIDLESCGSLPKAWRTRVLLERFLDNKYSGLLRILFGVLKEYQYLLVPKISLLYKLGCIFV